MMYQIKMLALLFGVTCISAAGLDEDEPAGGWGQTTAGVDFSAHYINVDELYYTHGDRSETGQFRDGFLDLTFKDDPPKSGNYHTYTFRGRQYRVTMYNTIMDILLGNQELGVDGIIQRLIAIKKTPETVTQDELRDVIKATIDALKVSYDCTPEVISGDHILAQHRSSHKGWFKLHDGISGRMYSNNNRSLYVFQTIRTMFPASTVMMIPYKVINRMSWTHRASTINHINRMDTHKNPGMGVRFGDLFHQPPQRRADINEIFTKDADEVNGYSVMRISAGALKQHVLTKIQEMELSAKDIVFSLLRATGKRTGGRFGNASAAPRRGAKAAPRRGAKAAPRSRAKAAPPSRKAAARSRGQSAPGDHALTGGGDHDLRGGGRYSHNKKKPSKKKVDRSAW